MSPDTHSWERVSGDMYHVSGNVYLIFMLSFILCVFHCVRLRTLLMFMMRLLQSFQRKSVNKLAKNLL